MKMGPHAAAYIDATNVVTPSLRHSSLSFVRGVDFWPIRGACAFALLTVPLPSPSPPTGRAALLAAHKLLSLASPLLSAARQRLGAPGSSLSSLIRRFQFFGLVFGITVISDEGIKHKSKANKHRTRCARLCETSIPPNCIASRSWRRPSPVAGWDPTQVDRRSSSLSSGRQFSTFGRLWWQDAQARPIASRDDYCEHRWDL